MNKAEIIENIHKKQTVLCVGLDSDIEKIPPYLHELDDPIFEFNKKIFDATHDLSIAYKINIAFYESQGIKGWKSLKKTVDYIRNSGEKVFLIADAKRGDIGNTSKQYAKAFFDKSSSGLDFDAVTVAPYMGIDSVQPFLEYENKWAIILGLTSNKGAFDFQLLNCSEKDKTQYLFEYVLEKAKKWGTDKNIMFVIGATRAVLFDIVRKHIPNHFLLIPGVGTQGGSLKDIAERAVNQDVGVLVNNSRSIIFASNDKNFDNIARKKAKNFQNELKKYVSL